MKVRESDKPRMRMTGVYAIVNLVNEKIYIGSASNEFGIRMRNHRSDLRKNRHHSGHLQRAWNKYGEDAFEFRILETTKPEWVIDVEQSFLDAFKTSDRKNGYNLSANAANCRGVKHTPETRERMSKAQRNLSPEAKASRSAAMSAAWKDRVVSAETRARISAGHKGRIASPESRLNMSAAQKRRAAKALEGMSEEEKRQREENAVKKKEQRRAYLKEYNKSYQKPYQKRWVAAIMEDPEKHEEYKKKRCLSRAKRVAALRANPEKHEAVKARRRLLYQARKKSENVAVVSVESIGE